MNDFIAMIILLTGAVMIHEIGHLIALKVYQKKYKMRLSLFGIFINFDSYSCRPMEIYIISFAGILAGFIVLIPSALYDTMLIYFIMCSIDITNCILMLNYCKFKGMTMREIMLKELSIAPSGKGK